MTQHSGLKSIFALVMRHKNRPHQRPTFFSFSLRFFFFSFSFSFLFLSRSSFFVFFSSFFSLAIFFFCFFSFSFSFSFRFLSLPFSRSLSFFLRFRSRSPPEESLSSSLPSSPLSRSLSSGLGRFFPVFARSALILATSSSSAAPPSCSKSEFQPSSCIFLMGLRISTRPSYTNMLMIWMICSTSSLILQMSCFSK